MSSISFVQDTRDYSKFQYLTYNRTVDLNRVDRIMEAIKKNGFLVPILVNKNYFIVDGQHRLQAAEKLQCSLSFLVYDIADDKLPYAVSDLNATAKTWSLEDYLHLWTSLDREERESYLQLIKWQDEYEISFTLLYRLVYMTIGGVGFGESFKLGKMTFTSSQSTKVLTKLTQYQEIKDLEQGFKQFSTNFLKGIVTLVVNKQYNHERMKIQLHTYAGDLLRARTTSQFLIQFEAIYNKGLTPTDKQRIRLIKGRL